MQPQLPAPLLLATGSWHEPQGTGASPLVLCWGRAGSSQLAVGPAPPRSVLGARWHCHREAHVSQVPPLGMVTSLTCCCCWSPLVWHVRAQGCAWLPQHPDKCPCSGWPCCRTMPRPPGDISPRPSFSKFSATVCKCLPDLFVSMCHIYLFIYLSL